MEPVAPPWPPDRRWPGWPPELHHHEIAPPVWNWAAPAAPNVTVGWINHGYFPYTNNGVLGAPSAVDFGCQEPLKSNLEAHRQAPNQRWHETEEGQRTQFGTAASASISAIAKQPVPEGGQSKGRDIYADDEYDEDAAMWA